LLLYPLWRGKGNLVGFVRFGDERRDAGFVQLRHDPDTVATDGEVVGSLDPEFLARLGEERQPT
jgi:hypothetical protein